MKLHRRDVWSRSALWGRRPGLPHQKGLSQTESVEGEKKKQEKEPEESEVVERTLG